MRTTTNNTSTSQPISMKNTTRLVNGPCRAALLPGGAAATGAEAPEVASWRGLPSSLIVPFWHPTPRARGRRGKRNQPAPVGEGPATGRDRRLATGEVLMSQIRPRRCLIVGEDGNQLHAPRDAFRSLGSPG
jgi:hypothetical protein